MDSVKEKDLIKSQKKGQKSVISDKCIIPEKKDFLEPDVPIKEINITTAQSSSYV